MFKRTFVAFQDLPRMREVIAVLVRHGLGTFLQRIKLVRWKNQSDENRHYISLPKRFCLAFEELGSTFVKLGQILSTRIDIFPPEWITEFSKLQNDVRPVPFDEIEQVLANSLPGKIDDIFLSIDPVPIGSASIAQVHKAQLLSGEIVAVKVKRPNINEKVEADIRILTNVVSLIEQELPETRLYQPKQMFSYFTKNLKLELDLRNEAQNLARVSTTFENLTDVHIPKVYNQYSNENILVQEYIDQCLLKNVDSLNLSTEQKKKLGQHLADAVLKMILIDGFFHGDLHPGNIFVTPEGGVTFIDFGLVGKLNSRRQDEIVGLVQALIERDQFSMQLILGSWTQQGALPDEGKLGEDVLDIMLNYEHLALKNLKISEVINDVISIIREHQLVLPADLVMLFKTLIMLESIIRQLDEDFELLEHTKPLVLKILRRKNSPKQLFRRARMQGQLYKKVIDDLPLNALYLGKHLRNGRFNINLDLKRLNDFGLQIDRTSNRLTMGIVTGSLIIGSSIVMSVEAGPKIFGLSIFGFLGYAIASIISLWLIWAIWRSGKH